jgi:ribose transport system substrate-binding protein
VSFPSRTLPVLLALLVVALPLHASAAEAGSDPRPLHIGFSQDTFGNDWRLAQAQALEQAFAAHPEVRLTVRNGRGSTAQQILDIEALTDEGVDLLMTSPKDSGAMSPVIASAYRRGIPVVLLTRRIDTDAFTSYVGPDDEGIARQAARFMAERLGGSGRILMLKGVPNATTAVVRTDAFLDELRRHPGLHVVAAKTANYLRSDAIRAVEAVLEEGIRFDAIYAQSDSMASGARMALKRAGIAPGSLLIVGIDYIAEAREAIRRGEQAASFIYPVCAQEGAAIALRILRGEPVPKRVVVDSVMVTRDNVDQVDPIF